VSVALLALVLGCRRTPPTQLVVGIQSEPMGGVVSSLHVVIKIGGNVAVDEVVKPPRGSRVGFPQPWEKALDGTGKGDALVEVKVDAIGDPNTPAPLFTRLASARFVPGPSSLLPLQLTPPCILHPTTPPAP